MRENYFFFANVSSVSFCCFLVHCRYSNRSWWTIYIFCAVSLYWKWFKVKSASNEPLHPMNIKPIAGKSWTEWQLNIGNSLNSGSTSITHTHTHTARHSTRRTYWKFKLVSIFFALRCMIYVQKITNKISSNE